MEKAVFLDRDGTINEDVGYVCKIEDFKFLPGALQGLKMLQDAGYLLVIITNQSGIARGYFTEREYRELEHYMFEKFRKSGIWVAGSYYCPHHPEGKIPEYRCICPCRKPEIGLFIRAAKEHNISFTQSFAIGDKFRDLAICEKKPCRGYLVGISGSLPKGHLSGGLSGCFENGRYEGVLSDSFGNSLLEGVLVGSDGSVHRKVKAVGSLLEAAKDIISLG